MAAPRALTLAIVGLALAAVALTGILRWTAGPLPAVSYAPAAALAGVLVAWPFANGWRPWERAFRSCPNCAAAWRPGDDGATTRCPACGI